MQLMFLSFLAPVSAYCDSHHGITDVHTHIIVPEYMEVLRAHGAGTLPHADGLFRLDQRGRSGGSWCLDGRQRAEYGLSAAGLPVRQEFIIKENYSFTNNVHTIVSDLQTRRHYEQDCIIHCCGIRNLPCRFRTK